ncbi:CurL C-terminal domain-containing protein, partial [Streptomyces asiaticus]
VPWLVSGKSREALRAQAERLYADVAAREDIGALDVGHTLASRSVFEHRAVLVGEDRETLLRGLRAVAEGGVASGVVQGQAATGGKSARPSSWPSPWAAPTPAPAPAPVSRRPEPARPGRRCSRRSRWRPPARSAGCWRCWSSWICAAISGPPGWTGPEAGRPAGSSVAVVRCPWPVRSRCSPSSPRWWEGRVRPGCGPGGRGRSTSRSADHGAPAARRPRPGPPS